MQRFRLLGALMLASVAPVVAMVVVCHCDVCAANGSNDRAIRAETGEF